MKKIFLVLWVCVLGLLFFAGVVKINADIADPSLNTAPVLSIVSDGGVTTNVGQDVTFTAAAQDAENDNYYLAICKTNSITANVQDAPTCSDASFCVSSLTVSGNQATCNYTTLYEDLQTNDWYAFVCDYSGNPKCSLANQGAGAGGSPFLVNHAPDFAGVMSTPDPVDFGSTVTFLTSASDLDGDLLSLYVCRQNDFTGTTCGQGGEYCHVTGALSDPSCNYTISQNDTAGIATYYAYVLDNKGLQSESNPTDSTFKINPDLIAPVVFAGANQTKSALFTQTATATDLGSGINSATYQWSKVSGPGTVTFGSPSSLSTTILANKSGSYVIKFLTKDNAGNLGEATFNLTWTQLPSAPVIITGPSDGGSSIVSPATVGSRITFTVTATDAQQDKYFLTVCRTSSVSANPYTAGTCGRSTLCTSVSTTSGAQASCSYTTTTVDVGNKDWYAFVCDYNSSSLCSAFNQGSGNNGSPFVVKTAVTPPPPAEPWVSGFKYRKKITISRANVTDNLTNFPLLIKIAETSGSATNIGANAMANGFDIRFTSADKTTLLSYERENYSAVNNNATGNFWVKVPVISSAADTVIYIYYGKESLSDGQNITGVWDDGGSRYYKGVWHFTNGSLLSGNDSSGYANNATSTSGVLPSSGVIGNSASFSGNTPLSVGYGSSLDIAGPITTEAWVNTSINYCKQGIFFSGSVYAYQFDLYATYPRFYTFNGGSAYTTGNVTNGAWHHIVATNDGSYVSFYIDGVFTSKLPQIPPTISSGEKLIGRADNTLSVLNGKIDELRVSSTARSASWLKFEYSNMTSVNNEINFASAEAGQ